MGESGHVYHFRMRTWDNVGNERPYPEAPDATTGIAAPVTKHYYANGQRVAVRQGDVVYYVHTDHPSTGSGRGLGSTSVLSDESGQQAGARVAYLPYDLAGALGQALGLITAKQGLIGDFPSLSATLIRMVVATSVIWLLTLARGQVGATWPALRDKRARLFIASGALTGPFVGVWLSMVAVQHAHVGIASTLMSLSPIIIIPLGHWVFHEKVSPRSVSGTVVAIAGATIIFLT